MSKSNILNEKNSKLKPVKRKYLVFLREKTIYKKKTFDDSQNKPFFKFNFRLKRLANTSFSPINLNSTKFQRIILVKQVWVPEQYTVQ